MDGRQHARHGGGEAWSWPPAHRPPPSVACLMSHSSLPFETGSRQNFPDTPPTASPSTARSALPFPFPSPSCSLVDPVQIVRTGRERRGGRRRPRMSHPVEVAARRAVTTPLTALLFTALLSADVEPAPTRPSRPSSRRSARQSGTAAPRLRHGALARPGLPGVLVVAYNAHERCTALVFAGPASLAGPSSFPEC